MKQNKLFRLASLTGALAFTSFLAAGCTGNSNSDTNEDVVKTEAVSEAAEVKDAVKVYDGKADLKSVPQKVTVIDFNATWCGPCRQFAPIFHSVAEKMGDKVDFYSVDVDKYPELAQYYRVQAIPTIVVLRPEGTTDFRTGLIDAAQLETLISGK